MQLTLEGSLVTYDNLTFLVVTLQGWFHFHVVGDLKVYSYVFCLNGCMSHFCMGAAFTFLSNNFGNSKIYPYTFTTSIYTFRLDDQPHTSHAIRN